MQKTAVIFIEENIKLQRCLISHAVMQLKASIKYCASIKGIRRKISKKKSKSRYKTKFTTKNKTFAIHTVCLMANIEYVDPEPIPEFSLIQSLNSDTLA